MKCRSALVNWAAAIGLYPMAGWLALARRRRYSPLVWPLSLAFCLMASSNDTGSRILSAPALGSILNLTGLKPLNSYADKSA